MDITHGYHALDVLGRPRGTHAASPSVEHPVLWSVRLEDPAVLAPLVGGTLHVSENE